MLLIGIPTSAINIQPVEAAEEYLSPSLDYFFLLLGIVLVLGTTFPGAAISFAVAYIIGYACQEKKKQLRVRLLAWTGILSIAGPSGLALFASVKTGALFWETIAFFYSYPFTFLSLLGFWVIGTFIYVHMY